MYGEATDPIPYLAAAYALGAILIGGYAVWIWLQRRQIQKYLAAIDGPEKGN